MKYLSSSLFLNLSMNSWSIPGKKQKSDMWKQFRLSEIITKLHHKLESKTIVPSLSSFNHLGKAKRQLSVLATFPRVEQNLHADSACLLPHTHTHTRFPRIFIHSRNLIRDSVTRRDSFAHSWQRRSVANPWKAYSLKRYDKSRNYRSIPPRLSSQTKT